MTTSDEERRSPYYLSCQEYVCGELPSVPSPLWKHFKRQGVSASSLSSSRRSKARARQSEKPSLEELANRLIALEQELYLSRQHTEWMIKLYETTQLLINRQTFKQIVVLTTDKMNKCPLIITMKRLVLDEGGRTTNHFDEDVLDDNEAEKVLDEDVITIRTKNHFDEDVLDDNEATSPPPPVALDFVIHHSTHDTKAYAKSKEEGFYHINTPSSPPPYVADGEVVISKYYFSAYKVQHRFYNLILGRDFWSSLFGHTDNGWLDQILDTHYLHT
uniref:Uncharacterized protein n=1 Tax=Lactuca sativa TaxID=4236 RepID=A0A9R1VC85_LACSA|nr:hypothetical protein LSAT_V11C500276850 [Lactuca sativa]